MFCYEILISNYVIVSVPILRDDFFKYCSLKLLGTLILSIFSFRKRSFQKTYIFFMLKVIFNENLNSHRFSKEKFFVLN